ncbi:MAG TPA: anaerobic glycerol-3-phosphate dehydrogenase subunit C [Candidatus Limnocylindrales bacterium]|nr:anaerobic glycerol-3-phosphate dehydrogenase subunit C [Candidatus Limnocylindrales bacterium]
MTTIHDLVLESSSFEVGLSADDCLKCNVCNTVCPVARVTDRFPGPKYVGPQAQRFRLATLLAPQAPGAARPASPDLTVDWCSGCGMCTTACPADVKIAEMNSRARAQLKIHRRPPLRDWLLGQTDLVGRLGVLTAPIANWSLRVGLFRALVEQVIGIHRWAPLPMFARRTLRSRLGADRRRRDGAGEPPPDRAVVLFHGCAANYYEPDVALAAIDVLRRNGLETIVPPQVCCGLPMISNGFYEGARGRARTNLGVLADYARRGYRIVGTSTSCTHTLKAEYREMLDLDDADARAVSDATWDICEVLLDLHHDGRLDTRFGPIEETLPYHAPCQLRSHGIGLPAMDLFALVPGLQAIDLDHDCCGVAGTYGLKKEKYAVAMAVGAPLFEKVRAASGAGAPRAACDSETCRWQIAHATGTPVVHPIQVLAAAYAAADEPPGAAS